MLTSTCFGDPSAIRPTELQGLSKSKVTLLSQTLPVAGQQIRFRKELKIELLYRLASQARLLDRTLSSIIPVDGEVGQNTQTQKQGSQNRSRFRKQIRCSSGTHGSPSCHHSCESAGKSLFLPRLQQNDNA